ncbi:MAG TPA: aminotransferase class V-fold PLP-dependent enzyme [Mycobacteriales bacterium]|nr:aminotransferase class V-fold PLP-dependent enzyme [Mycobacteriales bacterium]
MSTTADWLLDPDIAYLNHGAFGALPRAVGEYAVELRRQMEANPTGLLARRLPGLLDDVRGQVAELLRADPDACVFVANATAGSAAVLTALAPMLEAGDEVVTTDHRYGAVGIQLEALAARTGARIVTAHVPLDAATSTDVVAAITERFTSRTRLLVVDSISSPSGFVFPVEQIVATSHERGIAVLVDAAHAPGQIEVDLRALGADFWVGNLHKWICSPRAAAVLCIADRWRADVRPLVPSHGYPAGFQPAFDWTGTLDPTPILAVPAALAFWSEYGWERMRGTQRATVDDGAASVAKALGTSAPVADEFRAAMRIIELPVTLGRETGLRLEARLSNDYRVEVPIMQLHNRSWIRVCGQVYNDGADYDRLAAALPELLETEEGLETDG